jgi:hypothetical protein
VYSVRIRPLTAASHPARILAVIPVGSRAQWWWWSSS